MINDALVFLDCLNPDGSHDTEREVAFQKAVNETPEMTWRQYLNQTIISGKPGLDFERGICIEDGE